MSERQWPERIGPYEIQGVLGEGAMGRVYLARQQNPDREVALKVLKSLSLTADAQRRFEREIAALSALEHPHIARVYAAGESESAGEHVQWFAMERIAGQDLHRFAERGRGPARILPLMATIARTVHFAHTRGVVHRDIKPGNILVRDDGAPCVLDFGVAHLAETDATQLTQMAETLGTLPYMSPETLMGTGASSDPRIDVYALGVVAYELLAGQLPYDTMGQSTIVGLLDVLRRDMPRPLRQIVDVPADLETVVMKAIEQSPERRYASAAEFAADLERFLGGQAISARPPSAKYVAGLFVRRHKVWAAAVGLVLVSSIGATIVSARYAYSEARARQMAEAAQHNAEARNAELRSINQFVEGMLSAVTPAQARGETVLMRDVLDAARAQFEAAEGQPDNVRAALAMTLGASYRALGEAATAEDLLRAAVERGEPGRARTLQARLEYAQALLDQEKREETKAAINALLGELDSGATGEHPRLATQARITLASAHLEGGDADTAIALLRPIYEDAALPESTRHAAGYVLANAVEMKVDVVDAIAITQQIYSELRASNPPTHLERMRVGNALAYRYLRTQQFDQALPLIEEVLANQIKVYGADHKATISTRDTYALALMFAGRLPEALAEATRVIDTYAAMGAHDSPVRFIAMQTRAKTLVHMGDLDAAEIAWRETIAAATEHLGANHPHTLVYEVGRWLFRYKRLGERPSPDVLADIRQRADSVLSPENPLFKNLTHLSRQ